MIGNQLLVIGVCWSVIGDWLSVIIDEWLRQVIGDQWLLISDWLSIIGVCESVIGDLSLLISHEWLRHTSEDRANRWSVVVNQWSMIDAVHLWTVIGDQAVDRWMVISDQWSDCRSLNGDQWSDCRSLAAKRRGGRKKRQKGGEGEKKREKKRGGGRKKGKKGEGEEKEMAFKIELLEGRKAKIFGAPSAPFYGRPAPQRWPVRRRGQLKRKRRQLAIEWWKPHLTRCSYCGDIAF